MKITSVNNDLIKETAQLQQRKYRDQKGMFLIEGVKAVEEAMSYGLEIVNIFVLEGCSEYLSFENRIETTEAVLSKISSTATPPKVMAVAKIPDLKWSRLFKKVVLLEDIKDAGNLGTILRTACAFNIDAVILYGDTVDLYNPKCVRASVGNLWKIPTFCIKDFSVLEQYFSEFERIATLPKSENSIWLKDYQPQDKTLVMFGTESSGLSDELKNFATKNVTIEMNDKVESLNLSISTGVILYKFVN